MVWIDASMMKYYPAKKMQKAMLLILPKPEKFARLADMFL